MDDLISVNLKGINKLYKKFATQNQKNKNDPKRMSVNDAINLLNATMQKQPEGFSGSTREHLQKVVLAFCLSKGPITDDIKEAKNYKHWKLDEFYEFLGRWGALLYDVGSLPF